MTESIAGSIQSLWRYPVKSMLGEEIVRSAVTERGFVGDRVYALVDTLDGKVASAKNPRKWPRMYECRAELDETPRRVRIRLPDGDVIASDDPNAATVLSRILGREVALETVAAGAPVLEELWLEGGPDGRDVTDEPIAMGSPAGSFFDYSVIHLVTTATLERLSELYPEGRFDPRRFRPNVLVSVASEQTGFVENGWIGKTLALGDSVRLRVTDPCPRCVMTTLAQEDLPADAGILRTAARQNSVVGGEGRGPDGAYPAAVGVYASVVSGGTVRRGDTVRLINS
jgi:uncharacterized protein YcbX